MDGDAPSYVTRKTRVRHYRDFDRFFSGDWYPIVPEWTDHHWRVVHFAGGVYFRMVNPRLDTHAQVNRRCMSTLTYA